MEHSEAFICPFYHHILKSVQCEQLYETTNVRTEYPSNVMVNYGKTARSLCAVNKYINDNSCMRTDEWRWYDDVRNNYLVSIGVCICLWKLFIEVSLPIFVWWSCWGVFHLVANGVWNGVWSCMSLVCIWCLVLVLVYAYLAGSSEEFNIAVG